MQLNRQSSLASDGGSEDTSETFAAVGAKHFASTGASLAGKFVVSGGMGGMGCAQSLTETMNGACYPGIDVYFCF